jgi:hypothetical protein
LFGPWARIGWQRPNGLPEPMAPLLEPAARKKTTSGAKPPAAPSASFDQNRLKHVS